MACPGEGILTDLAKGLVDEVRYFRKFEDHVQHFGIEHNRLFATRNRVQKDIEDAINRNEDQIEDVVQTWIEEADDLIRKNTEIKQTWSYGWCPYWRYRQGKLLAQRVPAIQDHIQRCNFDRVARSAELPGIKYHASRDFIDFKSRKRKLNELVKALEDGNSYMIGLQGMGGTGKTTLATQVGKQLEESKAFEKVIIVVVSNPPDISKIQGEIARQLGSNLKEKEGAERSEFLWSTISNKKQKLLIILDDVWGELTLREIGIPSGPDHKNFYVMITTRDSAVCQLMRCQRIVHLDALGEEDALHLFMFHATSGGGDSSRNDSKGLARDLVKECGGLPVAIVALASTLRTWPRGEWNAALTTLRNSKPFVDVDQDLEKVYKCLRLSYDHLKDEKAQKLFLLCSIFPEDYEFPVNLIIRLGIGSGILGEVDEYYATRSQALGVKNKLIASSLLLKVEEKECVKLHDLVREVAQWIAKEDIQVIVPPRKTLEANKRFVFWRTDDFPDQIDGAKLEILLLWISGDALAKDPNAFFARMSRLKMLFLLGEYGRKVPSPLLSRSLLLLKNIQTLILDSWEIGDISVLKNLSSLVTLELENCLIIELPKDIEEIKKLRLLGLRKCEIQKNNPFEVIEICSQLEELYFVGNYDVKDWKPEDDKEIEDENAHDLSSSSLQMFSIACGGFENFRNDDNGLLKCFNSEYVKHLLSEGMFKYLVKSAEVLELGKLEQTGWKSLVPDVIPVENGGTNNLMKLYLYQWDEIKCLVYSRNYRYSHMIVFSRLVELHLYDVDVEELYRGDMPSGFLRQLQILKLRKCNKLQNIFSDENLKLPHLKIMELSDCPMWQPSIFQRSVAQSLVQLEELVVRNCEKLESLIACESLEEEMTVVDSQKIYGILFPKLKSLYIEGCHKLEMVSSLLLAQDLPVSEDLDIMDCQELKYIFGEYRDVGQVSRQEIVLPASLTREVHLEDLPSLISIFKECKKCMRRQPQVLKEDSKEKHENSKTSVSSWAQVCCFMAPTKDANAEVSSDTPERRIMTQESCASNERIETFHTTECLMRQPLCFQNIRQMTLGRCPKLKSIFRASMVTTIMLEKLQIFECDELKHIIAKEEEDNDHHDCTSIFPKLQQLYISDCHELEFIFPSALSGALPKLKSLDIDGAYKLKYVFGKYDDEECVSNENENNEPRIDLPALETLSLNEVASMISICINKYQLECPSLQAVEAPEESCASNERIEIFHTTECLMRQPLCLQNIRQMALIGCPKLKSIFRASMVTTIVLEKLEIGDCEELKHIIAKEEDDNDRHDCTSIFPKLQELYINSCDELEFIFPSALYGALPKLKSLYIDEAYKLKYVFGKYDDEEWVSNENENNEPRIDLPALGRLSLEGVPNMISICINKYQLECPSLQAVEAPEEIKEHMQDVTSEGSHESEIQETVNVETPLTPTVGFQNVLKLYNLQEIRISGNKLTTLFSISACRNLPQLSKLHILWCEELVNVVEDDSNDRHHMNYFPKLEDLSIWRCHKLEFIFPLSPFGSLQELKSLRIEEAAELKHIFRRYDDRDDLSNENGSDEPHIHLPALEKLTFGNVPKMINNICARKYHLSFPSLQCIQLTHLQEFNGRSFLDLNVKATKDCLAFNGGSFLDLNLKATKKLTKLEVRDSKIEEVLNLEGMEIEGPVMTLSFLEEMRLANLSELRHICKGPKYILSLHNLCKLEITACKELRSIFSVSIIKSLPQLSCLMIAYCDKLVDIIEESSDEDHSYQLCLPELEKITIKCCNSLKRIFSISTHVVFPKLTTLVIDEASELEQVFIFKQDAIENKAVEDVFPKLSVLKLVELPMLVAICEGIDFQTVRDLRVQDCSKYQGITSQFIVHTEETSGSSNSIKEIKKQLQDVISEGSDESEIQEIVNVETPLTQENDATEKATRGIQSTDSESRKQTGVSSIIAQSSEEIEKEAVRIHASQLSMAPTWTSSKITQGIKETIAQALEENYTEDDVVTAIQSTNSDSRKKYTGPIRLELEDEQSTCEATPLGQSQDLGEAKISIKFPHKTKIPFDDDSIEVIVKERAQESPTSKDVMLETLLADLGPSNLSAESIATPQEEFSLNLTKKESRSSTIMINQQTLTEKAYISTGNIQENTTTLKAKTDASFICSQAEGSQSSPTTMSGESIQEETTTVRAKIDTSFCSQVEVSQIGPSTMVASTEETVKQDFQKHDSSNEDEEVAIQSTNIELMMQPRGSLDMPLAKGFAQTTKETRGTNAQDGLPSDFITCSHHQSQTGADGSSSPVLEIGEILELMELKDGEPALLAKALQLHPQLRLSRGQRTRSVIAFCYRVLIDILVVLATKTPRTITTSDKLNLKENLDSATYLGFDKEWIESVRGKVLGIDMFDAMEEEIEAIKAKLGTWDVMLEGVQKQRVEIKEHIAGVISELVKSEFETKDSQFRGLLEDREELMKKMMEFRGIISGRDKAFGI